MWVMLDTMGIYCGDGVREGIGEVEGFFFM